MSGLITNNEIELIVNNLPKIGLYYSNTKTRQRYHKKGKTKEKKTKG